ncbi:hypothetical protein K431DRAFT_140559 [Polychaeton citri CBS 116435]|uniref:Uncharacterized protein n=1 Tax=Polychaeton citri CBS 116435 TaxID=1314669 RepID=A0A9P4Q4F3_9PEZI|nr:hypothetical protein K431DRAFT_140559 [Polychaeton citri CBS 116435]
MPTSGMARSARVPIRRDATPSLACRVGKPLGRPHARACCNMGYHGQDTYHQVVLPSAVRACVRVQGRQDQTLDRNSTGDRRRKTSSRRARVLVVSCHVMSRFPPRQRAVRRECRGMRLQYRTVPYRAALPTTPDGPSAVCAAAGWMDVRGAGWGRHEAGGRTRAPSALHAQPRSTGGLRTGCSGIRANWSAACMPSDLQHESCTR